MEQSIGVYGQDVLLWACMLRQTPQRPQAQVLLQQAKVRLSGLEALEADGFATPTELEQARRRRVEAANEVQRLEDLRNGPFDSMLATATDNRNPSANAPIQFASHRYRERERVPHRSDEWIERLPSHALQDGSVVRRLIVLQREIFAATTRE